MGRLQKCIFLPNLVLPDLHQEGEETVATHALFCFQSHNIPIVSDGATRLEAVKRLFYVVIQVPPAFVPRAQVDGKNEVALKGPTPRARRQVLTPLGTGYATCVS